MTKRLHITALVLMLLWVKACYYSDFEHYYVEPVADEPPVLTARTNLDTLPEPVVVDSLEVSYHIDIQDGEFYFLDARVRNLRIYDSDSTQGSFWLYTSDVQMPGIDTLNLRFYYSSNTNSLGDVLGIESLNLSLKYPIDFKWTPQ